MAKNDSNKTRAINELLKTMNANISEERLLLGNMRSATESLRNLYTELSRKNNREPINRSQSTISDSMKDMFENVSSINEAVLDIRDLLENGSTRKQHDSANPLSNLGSGNSGNNSGKSGQVDIGKYVEIAGRVFAAIGLQKLLSKLGQSVDKSIAATYNLQQITGVGESESYDYKGNVNRTFKGSSIYNSTEEWSRLSTVASSTGMDDLEKLTLKYTKAIAVGVESMALDTAELSNLLYTIEKRGTFTSAQLEDVIDVIYKYSSSSGEITPEELEKSLANSLDGLMYGANLSEDQYSKELEESTSVMAGMLDQGLGADFISQMDTILNDIALKGVTSSYYSQLYGIGVDSEEIRKMLTESGDYSGALSTLMRGISDTANLYGDDVTAEDARRMSGLGFSYDNQTRWLVRNYDDTVRTTLDETAESAGTAEEAAEDMSRSQLDKFGDRIENAFAPVIDWFAEKGIGGTELGFVGGVVGSLFGKKTLTGAKNLASKIFKTGANSVDDTANGVATAANSVDDVVGAAANSVDDVVGAAANSVDDVATAAVSGMDDVAKAALSSSDDVLNGVSKAASGLSKAGKIIAGVGIAIEAITTTVDATKAYKEGDNREGASEIAEGVGSIGGGLGGAAAGAAAGAAIGSIVPGIGTAIGGAIGGIIGGIGGGLGGGAIGRAAGGAIYDATTDMKEFTSEQALQIKAYYDEVSELYKQEGNDAAQKYTITEVVPYLRSIGVSASITDRYNSDVGKPDFMKDYENNKFIGYYAQGTPFLPSDGLIYAHEGEAIIPAQYNPVNNVASMRNISDNMVDKEDITDLYDLLREIKSTIVEFRDIFNDNVAQEQLKSRLNTGKAAVTGRKTLNDYI